MLSQDKLISSREYSDAWVNYCKTMYEKNCQEREAWKEASISYGEYVNSNVEFLKETFNY